MASTLMRWARRFSSETTSAVTNLTAQASTSLSGLPRRRLGTKELYLHDLSPSSQAQEIQHVFSRQGRVRSVTMNFAPQGSFARTAVVKFGTYEEAELAMDEHERHGTMLNGVQIQVSQSPPGIAVAGLVGSRAMKKGPGVQIFVSNMSYATTVDQIRAAFSSFGSVLNVNLFTRNNQSMGMAQVLFARKVDADAAINALNEISFDGRPLFVKPDSNYDSTGDYATQEEGVHEPPMPTSESAPEAGSTDNALADGSSCESERQPTA